MATITSKTQLDGVTTELSAVSVAANQPLDGCYISLFGRMNLGQNGVRQLMRQLGANHAISVTSNKCTHLITAREWAGPRASKLVKAALAKGVHVVSEDWLLETERLKKRAAEQDFLWSTIFEKEEKDGKVASAKGKRRRANDTPAVNGDGIIKLEDGVDDAITTAAKKSKTNSSSVSNNAAKEELATQLVKVPGTLVSIDPTASHYQGHTVYVDPATDMIYDASLVHVSTSLNYNKFAIIQIHLRPSDNAFYVWCRQGRVGELGTAEFRGDGTLPVALAEFEKLFKDKSGLQWSERTGLPKTGMYTFVERNYETPSNITTVSSNAGNTQAINPKSDLPKKVRNLLRILFDKAAMDKTLASYKYDTNKAPLGTLSQKSIGKGVERLQDLSELFDDPKIAYIKYSMQVSEAVAHLSDAYYSIIPHDFGTNRPPVIRNRFVLAREMELLESLSDMKMALKLTPVNHTNRHPADSCFDSLGLAEMTPLDHRTIEYQYLAKYFHSSPKIGNIQIVDIFRIRRWGEASRFENSRFACIPSDRRLLWHGSQKCHFVSILREGLCKAPPGNQPIAGMFGQGIYFADTAFKSLGYCRGSQLMLLSEVELGANPLQLFALDRSAHDTVKMFGRYSVHGVGQQAPAQWMGAGMVHPSLSQCIMPYEPAGFTTNAPSAVGHNEYVCYDEEQVQLRYLFLLK